MSEEKDTVACYEKLHMLAMSDCPAEAVAGRFMKALLQPFDDFEDSERRRGTKPADLALGEVHGAMVLACANAFGMSKPGRELQVAKHVREIAAGVIAMHLQIALKRAKEATP